MRNCLIGLFLITNILTGCAQMAVIEATDQGRAPELVIASDLVNALMQADGYHPSTTRLQIQKSNQSFGKYLNSVLVSVGYDIEYVNSAIGDRFVAYTMSEHQNSVSSVPKTYHLSVGDVEFKRDYETIGGRVRPASNLLMAGVDPMTIKLNDQIFDLGVTSESASEQNEQPQPPVASAQIPEQHIEQPVESAQIKAQAAASSQQTEHYSERPVSSTPIDAQQQSEAASLQHVSNQAPEGVYKVDQPTDSAIELLVNGESSPRTYNEGDNLVFTIRTQYDVRLSCYYQDPDGTVVRMYPNRFATQANIHAGELVHIPANDAWALQATRAGASDNVMCLSVNQNLQAAMSEFESTPDLEPLSVSSFDELLYELKLQTGITPQIEHLSISVN